MSTLPLYRINHPRFDMKLDFTELSHAEQVLRLLDPESSLVEAPTGRILDMNRQPVGEVLRLPDFRFFSVYLDLDGGSYDLVATFDPATRIAIPSLLRLLAGAPVPKDSLMVVGHDSPAPSTLDSDRPGCDPFDGFARLEEAELRLHHVARHPEDLGQDF